MKADSLPLEGHSTSSPLFSVTSNPDPEAELIRLARKGCRKSMNQLFAQYEERVKKFILRKVEHPTVVEDLLQDTLVQAGIGIKRFTGEARFSTWLTGIALNRVRNYCSPAPDYK